MLRPLLHTTTNVQSGLRILGILLAFPMILNSEMIRRFGTEQVGGRRTAVGAHCNCGGDTDRHPGNSRVARLAR